MKRSRTNNHRSLLLFGAALSLGVFLMTRTGVSDGPKLSRTKGPKILEPTELGAVRWGRDLDAALVQSKASGKSVFLLFQEVPG
ncbi:MAG: hypothetical protein AAF517_02740 [Planctomycetota bacterium]